MILKPRNATIIRHYFNPGNFKTVDEFYVVIKNGLTYTLPKSLIGLVMPGKRVTEARNIKSLPTKSTLVNSTKKKPYIRQQHYKPKQPKPKTPGKVLKTLQTIKQEDPNRFKKVVDAMNSLPNEVKERDLKNIIDTFYAHIYDSPTEKIDLSGLDVSKKINGISLFNHLMNTKTFMADVCYAKFAMALPEENVPTEDRDHDTINSMITYFGYRSKGVPDRQRNKYIDDKLSKILTPDYLVKQFDRVVMSPHIEDLEDELFFDNDIRNFFTALDYFTTKKPKQLKDIMEALKGHILQHKDPHSLQFTLSDMLGFAVAVSRKPKNLVDVAKNYSANVREDYTDEGNRNLIETAYAMIDDWSYSSNTKPYSILMRRTYADIFNIRKPNSTFSDSYDVYTHYHIGELKADDVPDRVKEAFKYIYKATSEAIKSIGVPKELYRGLFIRRKRGEEVHISPSLSSTSSDEEVALDFANMQFVARRPYVSVKEAEKAGVHIHPAIKKYVKGVMLYGGSTILKFDGEKLFKDGKIIHTLAREYQGKLNDYDLALDVDMDEQEFIVGF